MESCSEIFTVAKNQRQQIEKVERCCFWETSVSQCVVNVQGLLPAAPRLKAGFVQALPKWQRGFFKNHCTGERRGSSLFSLSWPFAVTGQSYSCWELLLLLWWELAVWPEFGYRRASFPCFVAFPEITSVKPEPWSRRLCPWSHN